MKYLISLLMLGALVGCGCKQKAQPVCQFQKYAMVKIAFTGEKGQVTRVFQGCEYYVTVRSNNGYDTERFDDRQLERWTD